MADRSQIEQLHAQYCEQTGMEVSLTLNRMTAWEAFMHRGFSSEDLELVSRNLKRSIKTGHRTLGCLGFTRLIVDLESFEELLAQFRALARKPKIDPGKAQVLQSTGRPMEPAPVPPKDAKTVLKGLAIAQKLRDFKENL